MSNTLVVSITLRSPFLTGNAQAPDLGLDGLMPRNVDDQLVFPSSQIKGILSDSLRSMFKMSHTGLCGWEEQKTAALMEAVFGEKSHAERLPEANSPPSSFERFSPKSAQVTFGDLVSNESYEIDQNTSKTRISRDDLTGSAIEGQFQRIEMIGKHGTQVRFSMLIKVSPSLDIKDVKSLLEVGFAPVTSIGATKTAGFGRIVDAPTINISNENLDPVVPLTLNDTQLSDKSIVLRLEFAGPFVVDTERPGTNTFIGNKIIPGGAIKAAFAESLNISPDSDLGKKLSKIKFFHARPILESENKRPIVLPFSLAFFKTGEADSFVADMANKSTPTIALHSTKAIVPAFEVDWKPEDQNKVIALTKEILAPAKLSVCDLHPVRETKVRTAIDSISGAAALEEGGGQLFSYEAVCPYVEQKDENGCKKVALYWEFSVSSVQPADIAELLQHANLSALRLGKIKTPVQLLAGPERKQPQISPSAADEMTAYFVIVLQTNTVMFEAAQAADASLQDLYQTYFEQIFPNISKLNLVSFFARQTLKGGYQALRFDGGREQYSPWLLTSAGSTFSVSIPKEQATDFASTLSDYLQSGLPVSNAVKNSNWKHCPFTPENGFGDFIVNPFPSNWRSNEHCKLITLASGEKSDAN